MKHRTDLRVSQWKDYDELLFLIWYLKIYSIDPESYESLINSYFELTNIMQYFSDKTQIETLMIQDL